MSVYDTPWLRVGVYRCPPRSVLWRELNDNIGERPHVVFPSTVVGLVRRGMRLTVTPNDKGMYAECNADNNDGILEHVFCKPLS